VIVGCRRVTSKAFAQYLQADSWSKSASLVYDIPDLPVHLLAFNMAAAQHLEDVALQQIYSHWLTGYRGEGCAVRERQQLVFYTPLRGFGLGLSDVSRHCMIHLVYTASAS
jgi:hypothetical protein